MVLVPAHNEEQLLGQTLTSLRTQTLRPDRIVVMADNCTDRTVEIARAFPGVEVYETVGNTARKSGALNQGYRLVRDAEIVVQGDADMMFDEKFVQELVDGLRAHPEAGALAARMGVQPFPGGGPAAWFLWMLQRLEYYSHDALRVANRGRVWCVSGSGGAYRNVALAAAAVGRPGPWSETSIVEDYALTLDIEDAGWKTGSAMGAFAWTDTMLTLRDLWRQRQRWSGGTFLEWRTRQTTNAIRADRRGFRRGLILLLANPLILVLLVLAISVGGFRLTVWSVLVPALFFLERLYRLRYVPGRRKADYLLALTVVPEFVYGLLMDLSLICAWLRVRFRRQPDAALAW